MESTSNKKKKILFAFDMDHTILSANSDVVILDLLSKESLDYLKLKHKDSKNWAHFMQEVYLKMKEDKIIIEKIKEKVENIPFNPGFEELFELIKQHPDRFDTLIISGANTLFIKWILAKHNLIELFPKFYSNIAEPNEDTVITIKPHHSHDCKSCDQAQCKKLILNEHLANNPEDYEHMIYVGDGENDYCPATVLGEKDVLFPRDKFPLQTKLYEKDFLKNLKCEVHCWEHGSKIIDEIKKII